MDLFFAAEIAALNPARPEPQMMRSNSKELTILIQNHYFWVKYEVMSGIFRNVKIYH